MPLAKKIFKKFASFYQNSTSALIGHHVLREIICLIKSSADTRPTEDRQTVDDSRQTDGNGAATLSYSSGYETTQHSSIIFLYCRNYEHTANSTQSVNYKCVALLWTCSLASRCLNKETLPKFYGPCIFWFLHDKKILI